MKERNGHSPEGGRTETSSAHRQASEWLVLIESGDATEGDRARFEAWFAEHPGHREAYVALTETWGRLTTMGERVRASGHVEAGRDVVMHGDIPRGRRSRRKSGLAWAGAAAVLVVAVLGGIVFLPGNSVVPYRTDVGAHRTVSLADGSTVELNTDSEMLVEYTDEQRWIGMSRGEAFFDVAEDTERPFIVTAAHGAIRAVGTGFAVRLKSPDVVSVTVTKGAVEITHSTVENAGADQPRQVSEPPVLRRGQRAEYDRDATRIEEVTPAELERTQAWRHGLLVFEDASLAEVIEEVNRYTETRLVIVDPEIGELRLGGTFKTGRVEALLDVLEKAFGIQRSRKRRDTIELHAPSADPAS